MRSEAATMATRRGRVGARMADQRFRLQTTGLLSFYLIVELEFTGGFRRCLPASAGSRICMELHIVTHLQI
jgi:hypothetical protein